MLDFWLTKKRAGEVGERLGREHLASLQGEFALPRRPRVHLIGHSFGARLLWSAVFGGVHPESLTLLQAPFSAFAFAEEVPGSRRSGVYRRLLTERLVAGRTVAVRSTRDTALAELYRKLTPAGKEAGPGRLGRRRDVIASSVIGVTGARGAGATEVELIEAQRLGLPLRPVVNVDASQVVHGHRDILHPEIATILLMAAGLLVGGPDAPRPKPEGP